MLCGCTVLTLLGGGCDADGLLLIGLDHSPDSAEVSIFTDTSCDSEPFNESVTPDGGATYSGDQIGSPPNLGLYVSKTWQGSAARVEVKTVNNGSDRFGCFCTALPEAGKTKEVTTATSDTSPTRCILIVGPGDDGGQSGDASPGRFAARRSAAGRFATRRSAAGRSATRRSAAGRSATRGSAAW